MNDLDPQIPADDPQEEEAAPASEEGAAEEFEGYSPPRKNLGRGALLFLVMIGAAATLYFVFMRSAPKAADAATGDVMAAQTTISEFLSEGPRNVTHMRQVLTDTRKLVQQFITYPNAQQVPLGQLKSNPFSYTPGTQEVVRPAAVDDDRQSALKAAQALQLQTIMWGEKSRTCLINNRLYEEGQSVEGFSIEKISASAVIVRMGNYRFELQLQH